MQRICYQHIPFGNKITKTLNLAINYLIEIRLWRRPVTGTAHSKNCITTLTFSRRRSRSLSYRTQSIDLQSKSMDWLLWNTVLHQKKLKAIVIFRSLVESHRYYAASCWKSNFMICHDLLPSGSLGKQAF